MTTLSIADLHATIRDVHEAKTGREEDRIQKAVIAEIKKRGVPGLIWWHTPNAGKRTGRAGRQLKNMGMVAGVPDLFFFRKGQLYALELKTEKGVASEAQKEFIADINQQDGYGCIAWGKPAALDIMEGWGLLLKEVGNARPAST